MALPLHQRLKVIEAKQLGKSFIKISQELNISYSTVRRIWKNFKQNGKEGLKPQYHNCGPKGPKYAKFQRVALMLKKKYSEWGADFILTIFEDRYSDEKLPSVRTIHKWFKDHKLNRPRRQKPEEEEQEVLEVHDCWQIDAKENIALKDGSHSCYLTTVDVKSGIALEAPVFPLKTNQSS